MAAVLAATALGSVSLPLGKRFMTAGNHVLSAGELGARDDRLANREGV